MASYQRCPLLGLRGELQDEELEQRDPGASQVSCHSLETLESFTRGAKAIKPPEPTDFLLACDFICDWGETRDERNRAR